MNHKKKRLKSNSKSLKTKSISDLKSDDKTIWIQIWIQKDQKQTAKKKRNLTTRTKSKSAATVTELIMIK